MFSCSKLRNYLLLQGGGVGDRIPRLLPHNHDPDGPEPHARVTAGGGVPLTPRPQGYIAGRENNAAK
jgi:hypothetical protein